MVLFIIIIGFFFRLVIAFWNGFYGPSFGADVDANGMHNCALEVAQNLNYDEFQIGTTPYTNILGTIYHYTIASLFIGSLISCIAWFISAIILKKCLKMFVVSAKYQAYAFLIYSFLPTSLMWTSVTMREPFQLMFLNLALYSCLKIYNKKGIYWWCLFFLSCIGMGVLHGALFAFSFFLLSLLLLFKSFINKKIKIINFIIIFPITILIIILGLLLFKSVSYKLESGLANAIVAYQIGGMNAEARTQYINTVEINSFFDFVSFSAMALFQYLFEPLPWKITSIIDITVLFENLIRFILLCNFFHYFKFGSFSNNKMYIFILLSYLAIETIWAIGTVSWGTAARHHLPGLGLLILIGFIGKSSNRIVSQMTHNIS